MRGKAELKTMEFGEGGVCKNARSDEIVTKDIGEDLNQAFGGFETKSVLSQVLHHRPSLKKVGSKLKSTKNAGQNVAESQIQSNIHENIQGANTKKPQKLNPRNPMRTPGT
jgi:hypothetical protein